MKAITFLLVLTLLALQAQAGSWIDESGVTHFYKDPPKVDLNKAQSYEIDKGNEQAAQDELNAKKQRWIVEDQQA